MIKILAQMGAKFKRQRSKKWRKMQFSADFGNLNSSTPAAPRNRQDSESSEFSVRSSEFGTRNAESETRSILVDYGSADTILVLEVADE